MQTQLCLLEKSGSLNPLFRLKKRFKIRLLVQTQHRDKPLTYVTVTTGSANPSKGVTVGSQVESGCREHHPNTQSHDNASPGAAAIGVKRSRLYTFLLWAGLRGNNSSTRYPMTAATVQKYKQHQVKYSGMRRTCTQHPFMGPINNILYSKQGI